MLDRSCHRVWFVACVGSAFAACIASAQTPVGANGRIESQLMQCAERTTDSARLACYDGIAESLRARARAPDDEMVSQQPAPAQAGPGKAPNMPSMPPVVDPETGVPVSAQNAPPEPRNPETFDTNVQQKQSIRVMIEKTRRNARGDWYFYFDNGEVWKQIDSRNRRIPALPVAATVSRGIFSSHKLHVDGEVWAMKVRRVK